MKEFVEFMQFILPFLERPDDPSFQTDHDMLYLCGVKFKEMSCSDIRYCMKHHFVPGNAEYYDNDILNSVAGDDWENITDEQWDKIKNTDESGLTTCLHSYYYGSC